MKRTMRLILALILLAALTLAPRASPEVHAAGDCAVNSGELPPSAEEQNLLNEINVYRLGDYVWSSKLSQAAVWMAKDNAARKLKDNHVDSTGRDLRTRLIDCGYGAATLAHGENTTAGNTYMDYSSGVLSEWMFSTEKWQNVVGEQYTHAGIARAYNPASPYIWYWVLVVGVEDGPAPPTPTPTPTTAVMATPTPVPPTATNTPQPTPVPPTPTPDTITIPDCWLVAGDWPGPFSLECSPLQE